VRRPKRCQQERNQKRERTLQGKISKTKDKQRLTLDLLLLHLEGAALGLDRLLKAVDGAALLPEGLLLARARDAEHHQLALEL
jgi:elongation factor P--beta-lysine ligase